MSSTDIYLKVAVEAPLPPLTYSSPRPHPRGTSLQVPLGTRVANGVVLETMPDRGEGEFEIKPVGEVHPERPLLPEPFLRWLEWLSHYYLHPMGMVSSLAFPPLKKKVPKKGSKKSKKKKTKSQKPPVVPERPQSEAPTYTTEQESCLQDISKHSGFRVHLVHGVTGSGKTEVYLKLLENTLAQGKCGVVIVPEISLTPQLIERFASRFPQQVAVIHSHLTGREKTQQWWAMMEKEKRILIGARSALFCPVSDLGIIVVDEEHEASFKQDEKLMYHARDAAVMLGQFHNCPVILGSATPSLETWKNTQDGKYHYHEMASRVLERSMPRLQVVDMRGNSTQSSSQRSSKDSRKDSSSSEVSNLPFWMSPDLHRGIKDKLDQKEQCALFLNRRGIAQTTICSSCGYVYECPNCAISLTLHKKRDLVCHYCNYIQVMPESCIECGSLEVHPFGLGTELIEKDLKNLFPQARLARADRDEIQNRTSLEVLIKEMEEGHIDILVGTQMITKGLDFPKLTLVGIVMADVGFHLPDFRSNERSFQLFTQVTGRAGRHSEQPGEVVIQTYSPKHPAILSVNNYSSFVEEEMSHRQEVGYPPFSRVATIRVQSLHHQKVLNTCEIIDYRLKELKKSYPNYSVVECLGPAPAPLAKIRNKFRYHFLLKAPGPQFLNPFCRQVLADEKWIPPGVRVSVDIDPVRML